MPRYRFADFVLSPRLRLLARAGQPLPLIPRYFDLLLFLIEHRTEAVHRRDIFDRVWTDVIVSDSALSQAIRTLRRTLGDDSREPLFIRTVSRHGYQFVCADVIEEDDDGRPAVGAAGVEAVPAHAMPTPDVLPASATVLEPEDAFERLLEQLLAPAATANGGEDQRDAAERLHALGTAEALKRLDGRPRAAYGRALLRDTRRLVAGAGDVPILGAPSVLTTLAALAMLRLRRTFRLIARRWLGGIGGGGLAGALAGLAGGLLLAVAPGSTSPFTVAPVLAAIGAVCGMAGAAGVGAGLSVAEVLAGTARTAFLVLGAAVGGALSGGVTQVMAHWTLQAIAGMGVAIGGLVEGLAIGGGVGAGYAWATRGVTAGLAAPRHASRARVALVTGAGGALAAFGLALAGLPLVGGTLHLMSQSATGAQVLLTPLGRLLGEPEFGPVTRALIALAEGGCFGAGLAMGLTRRH